MDLNNSNPVGLSGLEPPTSRLSGVRSNRLSYKPSVVSDARKFSFRMETKRFELSTSRMRTERSAAWRTFSRRNYSRTKSKKAYKNMTTAKNGVYSWAEKALPSCKRRAEVLSSCDDIKIMWRSTGAYRVRYVTRPAFPV